jgi:hypothetical protein
MPTFYLQHVQQTKSLWCWAACCEMLARHATADAPMTQSQIVGLFNVTVGKGLGGGGDANAAAGPAEINLFLRRHMNRGVEYAVQGQRTDNQDRPARLTWNQIRADLDAGKLMIVGANNHARLMVGYEIRHGVQYVMFMDPAKGGGPTEERYDVLLGNWDYRISLTQDDRLVRWRALADPGIVD